MQAASPMPTPGRVSVPARLLATARKPKRGVEGSMDVCIGAQVRIQRERLGMSLSALARESGLSLSMLSRVERGLVSSSTQTLGRIAAALQVRMGVFFEEALPPIANDEDASRPSSAGT
ncbi:ribosome-binding protein aMBF1 (putative translation factor) [Pseudacidovorax sp. 1753]|uniref:helix-turn-helix domain-containing protein n=1 Tax=Pseudacidovorax sp. 1753 TaxID=3156419 RepID=UPI00339AFDFE